MILRARLALRYIQGVHQSSQTMGINLAPAVTAPSRGGRLGLIPQLDIEDRRHDRRRRACRLHVG